MRLVSAAVAIMAVALTQQAAAAQTAIQSREIGFFVQTVGGAPKGCGMEFTYVFEDKVYKAGETAALTGSLTLIDNDKGSIVPLLKLSGIDFPGGPAAARPTPFSIHDVSISVDGAVYHAKAMSCEDPRAFCGSFSMMEGTMISVAVSRGGATLNFNRQAGGLDYNLPFDENPDKTQNLKKWGAELGEYANCTKAILDHAEKLLR